MPYAYTVVWCNHAGTQHVLLALKRFTGARFGGAAIPIPRLLNGAGQHAFPGGAINPPETAQAAAYREFHEETGVDLQQPATIAAYHILHNHVVNHAPAQPFSTLYVQVTAVADLNNLAAAINANILANAPLCQELDSVAVVAQGAVGAQLGPNPAIPPGPAGWYNPRMAQLAGQFQFTPAGAHVPSTVPAGFVPPHMRQQVTVRLNDPHNWHQMSVASLGAAVAAAALAAAVLAVPPVVVHGGPPPLVVPAHVGAPAAAARAWNLGDARQRGAFLAMLLVLGLAVAATHLMPYLYPTNERR